MSSSPRQLRLGVVVVALFAIDCAPAPPGDVQRDESALRALTIRERMEAMSEHDREACSIKHATWVPAVGGMLAMVAHARIVLCWTKDCGDAQYAPDGTVTNIPDLSAMPTSGILYIPEAVADDVPAFASIIGASFDHTGTAVPRPIVNRGYPVVSMKHPDLGFKYLESPSGNVWPIEQFWSSHRAGDYRAGYLGLAKQVKQCVLGRMFGIRPRAYLSLGQSAGVVRGNGLFPRDDPDGENDDEFPFDGVVQAAGGNGMAGFLAEGQRLADALTDPTLCYSPVFRVPNTNCLNGIVPTNGSVAYTIAEVDPAGGFSLLETVRDAIDYRIEDQSPQARRDWRKMEYGAALKVKTIILAGLRDFTVEPEMAIEFAQRIVDAGAAEQKRLYFFKTLGHMDTTGRLLPAATALLAWVVDGVEPPALSVLGSTRTSRSCETRGFTNDPLACAWNEFNSP